ncbi:family 12 putative glycoside hydrolase [Cercophora samala]|uniref:Family 12 putative glycoside hydrolase n=1 Tax=Cercophora samala TaxID=330535 RepID=A0AA39ZLD1_9PEZI|nr:family 12 putative glycoside hydrolase [Cercophora samala]
MKVSALLLAAATLAQGSSLIPRQRASLCELYAYWSGNGYELLNNLWGKDTATSGSQCTYLNGASNNGISWSTSWNWQGAPDNVKSYPYSGRQFARGRKISSINRMPTSVTWRYDNENVRANVAYDVFTAADPDHPNYGGDYELMIWLARYGNVYPIGTKERTVTLAGRSWDLWVGWNGAMRVYSFVVPSGTVKNFSADVKEFFRYLESNYQYPSSQQNLIVYQVGTEAFTGGPATFTVDNFSADLQ